jgi:threonine dehydrogenase-like Zn-dependent dehydrogenase
MKSIFLDIDFPRVVLTRALGRLHPAAYFSRVAPVRFADLPDPPLPGPRWLRIHNRLAGICGTDLHLVFIEGDLDIALAALPGNNRRYLGHEIVGEVVEAGPGVEGLRVGDRVVFQRNDCCLTAEIAPPCRYCAIGDYDLCSNESDIRGPRLTGGGWGTSFIAHQNHLYRLPDDVTDEQAVLIESAACGVHAALRRQPQAGEHVLVLGCGIIGLMTLGAVRAVAPQAHITALARHPFQANAARRMGADQVIRSGDYREVARLTGARLYTGLLGNRMLLGGFDVIYDCVGKARTVTDALRWARAGGTVIVVGIDLHRLKVDLTPVWYQEVNLVGSMSHGAEDWNGQRVSDFDLVVRFLREGKLNFDGLITHRFPLDAYREAIATATAKRQTGAIKVIFDLRGSREAKRYTHPGTQAAASPRCGASVRR